MTETLLYIGSVIRTEAGSAAWERLHALGVHDPTHLITQLYENGAVAIGGYLMFDNRLSFAGSFSQDGSIYKILHRLSLAEINVLTTTALSPFSISDTVYNQDPVRIQLKPIPG